MKSILYISFLNEDIRPGYKKKIHSQVNSFSKMGYDSYLLIESAKGFRLYRVKNGIESIKKSIYLREEKNDRQILSEFEQFYAFIVIAKKLIDKLEPEYVYIRRIVPITPSLIGLIRYIKTKGGSVIYEYPTLPWKEEMRKSAKKSIYRKLFYLCDLALYKILYKQVDVIPYMGVYAGNDKKFIKIQNCGREEDFPVVHPPLKRDKKEIRLIGVAHIAYVHGYDLVIEALGDYYKNNPNREVHFDLVGTTNNPGAYIELIKQSGVEQYVHMHGFKVGDELDDLINNADIGVNALRVSEGQKKGGLTTLKTVEYTYRGLPQINAAPLQIDGDGVDIPDFIFYVEDKIDISKIVCFYENLEITPNQIREYAINHFSWEAVYMKMFDKIKTRGLLTGGKEKR